MFSCTILNSEYVVSIICKSENSVFVYRIVSALTFWTQGYKLIKLITKLIKFFDSSFLRPS